MRSSCSKHFFLNKPLAIHVIDLAESLECLNMKSISIENKYRGWMMKFKHWPVLISHSISNIEAISQMCIKYSNPHYMMWEVSEFKRGKNSVVHLWPGQQVLICGVSRALVSMVMSVHHLKYEPHPTGVTVNVKGCCLKECPINIKPKLPTLCRIKYTP